MEPSAVREVGHVPHGSSDDFELLDFSANINPEIPAGTRDVYVEAFEQARRYPAEPPGEFLAAAGAYLACEPEAVVPTPGGLAGLRLAIECLVSAGDSVVVPFPSFSEYAREVKLQGARPEFVPASDILETAVEGHEVVLVCNPNNPTGETYLEDQLRAFVDRCRAAGTTVVCDEAFLGFTDHQSLAGSPGVVVVRSLTKLFGLPGLRAGFLVADGEIGTALQAARQPWNLGLPALAVGTYCLHAEEFITQTRDRVETERARLGAALSGAYEVYPSDAPFLLLDVGDQSVEDIIARARTQGVIVRDATTFRGLDSHIRVAIRLPEQNDQLLEALDV